MTALVVVNLWGGPSRGEPGSIPSPSAGESPITLNPLRSGRTFVGLEFDPSLVDSPTAEKAQSKAWYAEDTWWLIAVAGEEATHRIYRLDLGSSAWLDTGVIVDERPDANIDALIDGSTLYVASAGPRANAASAGRLTRFHYVADQGRYVRDPDFPVNVSDTGAESMVLAHDGRDRLWATWMTDGRLMVSHSLDDDRRWTTPSTPPVDGVVADPDDVSAAVGSGGRIGIMWSNQRDGAVYYVEHRDDDADGRWGQTETVVQGANMADDHINLKEAVGGRIVAALKTSRNNEPGSALLAQILLAVRDPDGTWRQAVAGRVKDRHTRPMVLVAKDGESAYLLATSPYRGGVIYVKQTRLDRLAFESGVGTPLIASPDDPQLANVTSTKQPLDPAYGLVATAADNTTGRYVTAIMPIAPGGGPAAVDLPPLVDSPLDLVGDQFEVAPLGGALPFGWSVRAPAPDKLVVTQASGRGFLRLATPPSGAGVRACRAIPGLGSQLTAGIRIRVSTAAGSDAATALVRGPEGDVTELRFARNGRIAYVRDGVRVLADARWTPGRWYDVSLELAAGERQARITVTSGSGSAVVALAIPWSAEAKGIDELCVGLGPSAAGRTLDVDSLSVVGLR